MEELYVFCVREPGFSIAGAKRTSEAAHNLAAWVDAVMNYDAVMREVKALQEELDEANGVISANMTPR